MTLLIVLTLQFELIWHPVWLIVGTSSVMYLLYIKFRSSTQSMDSVQTNIRKMQTWHAYEANHPCEIKGSF